MSDLSLPPTTTAQQDITTDGQRRINLIWEYTQAFIAVTVVICTMAAGIAASLGGKEDQVPNILCTAFGMVVGAYFQRTNHVKIGGTGDKPYEGR